MSPTYLLRQATADDYDFLYELHRAAMREYIEPIWGWHEEWQSEYFREKFDPVNRMIIEVNGEDAGVVVVDRRPDVLYLSLIELLPKYQGRGIGSTILEALKVEARSMGLPLALHVLETNTPARRLYERLGFHSVSRESFRYYMVCHPGDKP